MFIAKTLSFYKSPEVQDAIVKHAEEKEIAIKYGDRGFGKRPQVIKYPNDVMELAKSKASSFHASEEIWENPMLLNTDMKREDQDNLRKGWDFILDLDCKFFEYSKIATHYTVKALEYCDVKSITVKFSGNKGFHIAVPWEAFPKELNGESVKNMFPEAPKRMAEYIKFLIKDPVREEIKKREGNEIEKISKKVGISVDKIKVQKQVGDMQITDLNVEPFIEMDTLLISSRHLYRMPYSFHEKSELVSAPIDKDKILEFEKEMAQPEKVNTNIPFLERDVEPENAKGLLVRAFDYKPEIKESEKEKKEREFQLPEEAIGEECFPPTIKKILAGVNDGRKRSVFLLINFLRCSGWGNKEVEEMIYSWNKKNREKLREVYIKGQLKHGLKGKPKPPPNYSNKAYYDDIGAKPSDGEIKFKNPLQFAKKCSQFKGKKK